MTDTAASVLILGATSDVGRALAHEYAAAGHPLELASRDTDRLAQDRDDLGARHGVAIGIHRLDILDPEDDARLVAALNPFPAVTVCLVGMMASQDVLQNDPSSAEHVLRTNFNGPARLLGQIANLYEARGSGTIVGVSSVAGDRGRATNYTYGSAKAGFTAWLSGLRNRLQGSGVHVMTVKPGFVRTRMTEGMELPGALTASAPELANGIRRAQISGRDVIYRRRIWWLIMLVIRSIPEPIFKRLSL